jgi:hypothetical protein
MRRARGIVAVVCVLTGLLLAPKGPGILKVLHLGMFIRQPLAVLNAWVKKATHGLTPDLSVS